MENKNMLVEAGDWVQYADGPNQRLYKTAQIMDKACKEIGYECADQFVREDREFRS